MTKRMLVREYKYGAENLWYDCCKDVIFFHVKQILKAKLFKEFIFMDFFFLNGLGQWFLFCFVFLL